MSGSRSADIPDTTPSLVARRKAQAEGWPPLSPHALTRVRMPVVPGAGRAIASCSRAPRKCTWNEPKPSVQRPTWSGSRPIVNARFDRAGVQDPAAGAAHGGDIGSEKDQHVREGFLNAGTVGTP